MLTNRYPQLTAMRVGVTGANGFLGQALCRAVLRAGGVPVAIVRAPHTALTAAGVETTVVDWTRGVAGVQHALQTIDSIVHSAGGGRMRRLQDVYDANLETTHTLLEALAGRSLHRFVLVSSVAAHGPSRDGRVVDESSPPTPASHYGRSKWMAEQALDPHPKLNPVSLRLPALYGPLDDRMFPLWRAAAGHGVMPVVLPNGETGLLHVDDAAELVLSALANPATGSRVYFADDGAPLTRRHLCETIGACLQRQVRVVPMPTAALWTAGLCSEAWARATGQAVLLTRDKHADLRHPWWRFSRQRVFDELGWTTSRDRIEAFEQTRTSYFDAGWLSPV
jgi:nucleoside-diphosphate-sugar epimerase